MPAVKVVITNVTDTALCHYVTHRAKQILSNTHHSTFTLVGKTGGILCSSQQSKQNNVGFLFFIFMFCNNETIGSSHQELNTAWTFALNNSSNIYLRSRQFTKKVLINAYIYIYIYFAIFSPLFTSYFIANWTSSYSGKWNI